MLEMPKCIGDPKASYNETAPSPKGLGTCTTYITLSI
jgi:hypothetical protein